MNIPKGLGMVNLLMSLPAFVLAIIDPMWLFVGIFLLTTGIIIEKKEQQIK